MAFTHVHGFSVNINLCLGAKEHGKLLKEPFKIRELEPCDDGDFNLWVVVNDYGLGKGGFFIPTTIFPARKGRWVNIELLYKFLTWDTLIKKLNCSLLKFFGVVFGGAGFSKFFEVSDKLVEL